MDVGRGAGAFSRALAYGKHLVIALDIKRLLREIKTYIEKVCADAHRLPLRDGLVDYVFSHFLSILKTEEVRGRALQSVKVWWDSHYPTPKPPIPFRTSYEMAVVMLNAEEASIKNP